MATGSARRTLAQAGESTTELGSSSDTSKRIGVSDCDVRRSNSNRRTAARSSADSPARSEHRAPRASRNDGGARAVATPAGRRSARAKKRPRAVARGVGVGVVRLALNNSNISIGVCGHRYPVSGEISRRSDIQVLEADHGYAPCRRRFAAFEGPIVSSAAGMRQERLWARLAA